MWGWRVSYTYIFVQRVVTWDKYVFKSPPRRKYKRFAQRPLDKLYLDK
jgi:hypothetical protein